MWIRVSHRDKLLCMLNNFINHSFVFTLEESLVGVVENEAYLKTSASHTKCEQQCIDDRSCRAFIHSSLTNDCHLFNVEPTGFVDNKLKTSGIVSQNCASSETTIYLVRYLPTRHRKPNIISND